MSARSLFIVLVSFLVALPVHAQEAKNHEAFWIASKQFREIELTDERAQVKRLERELAARKRALVNKATYENGTRRVSGRLLYPTAKAKADAVAAAQAELDRRSKNIELMEAGKAYPVPRFTTKGWKVGAVGYAGPIDVQQVVSADEFLGQIYVNDLPVWVSGIPTEGLVDGARIKTEGFVIELAKTRTYTTALGASRTVFEARPIRFAELEKELGPDETLLPLWKAWEP